VITRVHHVGIAVTDLAAGYAFWRDTLGLPLVREAEVPDQGVRAALLACNACEIELLEPTSPTSPVGRFLESRGPGLHHLCLESDNVDRDIARFFGTGVELIDAKPRKGLVGRIAFIHPRACAGILTEIATPDARPPSEGAPLTATVIHMIVESVATATILFRDMFGLPIRISHPDWSIAQLAAGPVAIQLSSTTATAGKPGISMLRLMTRDVVGVADRLTERGVAFRQDQVGLVMSPGATQGVALIVHQPQS
jgi:methylmalonyl-CoA/ethylmalonyl-CoA epimerase